MFSDHVQSTEKIRLDRDQKESLWDAFFQEYHYYDKITELSSHYPEQRSLFISYEDIDEFDVDFATYVLQNSEEAIEIAISRVRKFISNSGWNYLIKDSNSIIINIRLYNLPEHLGIDIRNIRSMNVGKLLSITGIIRKNTEVIPRLYNAAFQCSLCGSRTYVLQNRGKLEEPERCSNEECHGEKPKARFSLIIEDSQFIDTEKIELQENPETINGGAQPLRLTVIVEDDLSGKLFPGDRVTMDGILRAEQKIYSGNLLTEFNIFLYAINFRKTTKELEEIKISDAEEESIRELSRDPKIIDKLADSIAPTIYGLDNIKKTLVLQMFGGVRKFMKDGTIIRGDIHILMVGDPGTAKSQLLRYMSEISPRGVMAIGKGSSAAGLTAAAVRDEFGEGRWTLEAGALVLADNGFVSIDELDKMDERDTSAMHEAMEQQTVTISKAGIMATLKSRCSVLAAANPKNGRFDAEEDFMKQLDFPLPLISRFDVIFKLIDNPDQERDKNLADHVLEVHRLGEIFKSMEMNNVEDGSIGDNERKYEPPIPREMLRKYVAYAKGHIIPRLTDEAMEYLSQEYVLTRNTGHQIGKYKSVPITARQLESTIRLAEAAAKARLSEFVSIDDAMLAKRIVDSYLKDVASDDEGVDIDLLMTGTSARQRSDLEIIYEIIADLKGSDGSLVKEQDILRSAMERGIPREKFAKSLERARETGYLYSPGPGYIDRV
ncbi:MAG: minichromosome maintenance protein MCM [Cuniculiplasma sp.]|nr:minichromosome maintenance protein MCM [Cuniculiplasma sp.]